MNKTIIFMSGILIPNWLAKTKFVWDKSHWKDYDCIWLESKIPYSDIMVERKLNQLQLLLEKHPGATLAGHSLGAWWSANLACRQDCNISKMVLWTPLVDHSIYPIFNASSHYNPCKQIPNPNNIGSHKVLICYGSDDLMVPHQYHSYHSINHFQAMTYQLKGGHYYQNNHKNALKYMKEWIEIK
jgi:predicted esterase